MAFPAAQNQAIVDLEARHDEVLRLLADLEKRVAAVLAQHVPSSARPSPTIPPAPPTGHPVAEPTPVRAAA